MPPTSDLPEIDFQDQEPEPAIHPIRGLLPHAEHNYQVVAGENAFLRYCTWCGKSWLLWRSNTWIPIEWVPVEEKESE